MILQNLFLLVSLDPFLFLGWIHVLTQTSRMWRQPEEPKIQRVKLLTFISLVLEFLWYKYIFEKLARLISNITSINFGWNCSIIVLFFSLLSTKQQFPKQNSNNSSNFGALWNTFAVKIRETQCSTKTCKKLQFQIWLHN